MSHLPFLLLVSFYLFLLLYIGSQKRVPVFDPPQKEVTAQLETVEVDLGTKSVTRSVKHWSPASQGQA